MAERKSPWKVAEEILVPGDIEALKQAGLVIVWADERQDNRFLSVIENVVCEALFVTAQDIYSFEHQKHHRGHEARHLCCLLARELNLSTWRALAKRYNRKMNYVADNARRYQLRCASEPALQERFLSLKEKVIDQLKASTELAEKCPA